MNQSKLHCKKVQKLLPRYISKELNEQITQSIDIHLQSCNVCKKELYLLQITEQTILDLMSVPEIDPSEGLKQKIISKLQEKPLIIPDLLRVPLLRLSFAAVGVLLLTFGVISLIKYRISISEKEMQILWKSESTNFISRSITELKLAARDEFLTDKTDKIIHIFE